MARGEIEVAGEQVLRGVVVRVDDEEVRRLSESGQAKQREQNGVSHFFKTFCTALASSRNSSWAGELGAYSATVRPVATASATTTL